MTSSPILEDDAGDLMSEGKREGDAAKSAAVVRIAVANPGGVDLNDHFVGSGLVG